MKFEWEQIHKGGCDSDTLRAQVIGGWIIRHQCWSEEGNDGTMSVATSLVFIPDPEWDWEID